MNPNPWLDQLARLGIDNVDPFAEANATPHQGESLGATLQAPKSDRNAPEASDGLRQLRAGHDDDQPRNRR